MKKGRRDVRKPFEHRKDARSKESAANVKPPTMGLACLGNSTEATQLKLS